MYPIVDSSVTITYMWSHLFCVYMMLLMAELLQAVPVLPRQLEGRSSTNPYRPATGATPAAGTRKELQVRPSCQTLPNKHWGLSGVDDGPHSPPFSSFFFFSLSLPSFPFSYPVVFSPHLLCPPFLFPFSSLFCSSTLHRSFALFLLWKGWVGSYGYAAGFAAAQLNRTGKNFKYVMN